MRTRNSVFAVAAVLLPTALAIAPASDLPGDERVFTFWPVVLDVASGTEYDCADPSGFGPDGLRACSENPPLVLTHPRDHGDSAADHSPNAWTEQWSDPDGTQSRSCGEWHADQAGYPGDFCNRLFDGGQKQVKYLRIYRCRTDTPFSGCDSAHYTNGIVKAFLPSPSSWQFYKTYRNGAEIGAQCNGNTGSGVYADQVYGVVSQDSSPPQYCGTTAPRGYWGGGATYYP